ncbi:hypothetical protein AKJ16_DCAP02536 [Drosera capensis]
MSMWVISIHLLPTADHRLGVLRPTSIGAPADDSTRTRSNSKFRGTTVLEKVGTVIGYLELLVIRKD